MRAAIFSPCYAYRYRLIDVWDPAKPVLNWLMLNPSTADETKNDPTIERCQRRAVSMGFGAIDITNLFALRSTNPRGLMKVADPVGPDNDAAIMEAARGADMVICGWGAHGLARERAWSVMARIQATGIQLHALRLTKFGNQPAHPLYIPYEIGPTPLVVARAG